MGSLVNSGTLSRKKRKGKGQRGKRAVKAILSVAGKKEGSLARKARMRQKERKERDEKLCKEQFKIRNGSIRLHKKETNQKANDSLIGKTSQKKKNTKASSKEQQWGG